VSDETPVADLSVRELLDGVASPEVTPSGGAVAAVGGAAGAALCEMTCIHTLARTDDGNGADDCRAADLRETVDDLATLRADLLALADEDVAAVEELQAALASTDSVTDATVQQAAERATEVPLETAGACCEVLDAAVVVTEAGAPSAVPDAGTGASLAHAGLRAGVWTARSNLSLLGDKAVVADARERAADLEAAGGDRLDDVIANVRETW